MAPVGNGMSMHVDRDARPDHAFSRASIVHVGHSAVVLRAVPNARAATDRLLVITGYSAGLMPGGIRLSDAEFARLRPSFAALGAEKEPVDATSWTWSAPGIDLRIRPQRSDATAVRALRNGLAAAATATAANTHATHPGMHPAMDPEPSRRRAPMLAAAASARDAQQVRKHVSLLIGAGPGTTPSGDDVIVGVLAGCALVGDRAAFALVAHTVRPVLTHTTVASRHYLSAAIDGRFGEHIHELAAAVTGHSSPTRAIARAKTWGSSSGIDALTGLLATLTTKALTTKALTTTALTTQPLSPEQFTDVSVERCA